MEIKKDETAYSGIEKKKIFKHQTGRRKRIVNARLKILCWRRYTMGARV